MVGGARRPHLPTTTAWSLGDRDLESGCCCRLDETAVEGDPAEGDGCGQAEEELEGVQRVVGVELEGVLEVVAGEREVRWVGRLEGTDVELEPDPDEAVAELFDDDLDIGAGIEGELCQHLERRGELDEALVDDQSALSCASRAGDRAHDTHYDLQVDSCGGLTIQMSINTL